MKSRTNSTDDDVIIMHLAEKVKGHADLKKVLYSRMPVTLEIDPLRSSTSLRTQVK